MDHIAPVDEDDKYDYCTMTSGHGLKCHSTVVSCAEISLCVAPATGSVMYTRQDAGICVFNNTVASNPCARRRLF